MSIHLPLSDVRLATADIEKLMSSGNARACMFHVCSLSSGQTSVPVIAKLLGWTQEETFAARTALEAMGLFSPKIITPPESDSLPTYTAGEIASYLDEDDAFKSLVDYTKIRLGKLLTTPDVNILLGLYSHLAMPAGVLMLLISHCVERTKKKNGESARVSMRYIEREGFFWYRNGIVTEIGADEYIRKKNDEAERIQSIARLLQIRNRTPSPTEEKYLKVWAEYGMDNTLIYEAYDKTVINTGALTWKYMNKILADWDSKNIRTLADLEKTGSTSKHPGGSQDASAGSPSNAAERLKRMRSAGKEIKQVE